jgi:sporulation protein YlmC with PRC-barrel domain
MATTTDMTKPTGGRLIAADKVNGTNVYNTAGEKIGSVEDVMIDKTSGRIAYAVMSFGGFLGMGEKHHPLPWSTLRYDQEKGGYVVPVSKEQLQDAPSYVAREAMRLDDETFGRSVHDFYKATPYWDSRA